MNRKASAEDKAAAGEVAAADERALSVVRECSSLSPAAIVSRVCTQKLWFPYMYHAGGCPRLHRYP